MAGYWWWWGLVTKAGSNEGKRERGREGSAKKSGRFACLHVRIHNQQSILRQQRKKKGSWVREHKAKNTFLISRSHWSATLERGSFTMFYLLLGGKMKLEGPQVVAFWSARVFKDLCDGSTWLMALFKTCWCSALCGGKHSGRYCSAALYNLRDPTEATPSLTVVVKGKAHSKVLTQRAVQQQASSEIQCGLVL